MDRFAFETWRVNDRVSVFVSDFISEILLELEIEMTYEMTYRDLGGRYNSMMVPVSLFSIVMTDSERRDIPAIVQPKACSFQFDCLEIHEPLCCRYDVLFHLAS